VAPSDDARELLDALQTTVAKLLNLCERAYRLRVWREFGFAGCDQWVRSVFKTGASVQIIAVAISAVHYAKAGRGKAQ
jgi:hypothetical protein